jgi:hypothetical protein
MAKIVRTSLIMFALASAMASFAQQAPQGTVQPAMGRGLGRFSIDGTQTPSGTTIFVDQDVASDTNTNFSVINEGNTLLFAPNSKFKAMKNAYRLKEGGSNIVTSTGLTAHLPNCYSVTPVIPVFMTLYEVNWSGNSALVYARKEDVRINYWAKGEPNADQPNPQAPDQGWIVKEGQMARIRDVKLCKPLIDLWPEPNLPTAMELLGTTAVVTSEPWWWPNMSSESPKN